MAQALYDVEQIDNGAKRFTVRPLPLNGAWEKIQLAIAAVILAGLFIGLASANVVLAVVLVGGTALLCVSLRSMKLKGESRPTPDAVHGRPGGDHAGQRHCPGARGPRTHLYHGPCCR